jgi:DNA repair protein RecO (recombination protein O)
MPRVTERGRVFRTDAIVLRRMDLGEADRLLTLFTPQHGKLRAVAKGVRRPGSKKAGHLEPFTLVNLLLARGRELDIITQAEAVRTFPQIRTDLLRLGLAASVAELIDRFGVQEGDSLGLFQLAADTLDRLDRDPLPEVALRYFQIWLLDLVGYRPELFRCVSCSKPARPVDQFFSLSEGGLLCPSCGPQRDQARPLTLLALKVLRHTQRNSYAQAARPKLSPSVAQELDGLLESYLSYLLERELNVPGFLRQVRRLKETSVYS